MVCSGLDLWMGLWLDSQLFVPALMVFESEPTVYVTWLFGFDACVVLLGAIGFRCVVVIGLASSVVWIWIRWNPSLAVLDSLVLWSLQQTDVLCCVVVLWKKDKVDALVLRSMNVLGLNFLLCVSIYFLQVSFWFERNWFLWVNCFLLQVTRWIGFVSFLIDSCPF